MLVAARVFSLPVIAIALASASACTDPVLPSTELDSSDGTSIRASPATFDAGSSAPVRADGPDARTSGRPPVNAPASLDAGGSPRDASSDPSDASSDPSDASDAIMRDASTAPQSPRDAAPGTQDTSAPAPAPSYMLTLDAPTNGASVKSPVLVRGRGPGFLNVEVWDAQHSNPPLGRATPRTDGSFEISIDISSLPSGATTWTVHGWDSASGATFAHSDSVDLSLTLQTASLPPSPPAGGTGDPGTKYVPSGYMLAFSDEFTGSALDTGKWNTLGPFGVRFFADSQQKQYFVPEAVTLTNGLARFTARKSSGNTQGQPYSSGSLTTNGTFTHGYFEARVKVPAGKGFWPAYWLTSSTRWPPEWDIFEIIDNVIFGYTHPLSGGKCTFVDGAAGGDSTYMIANLYDTWHVYGFLWTASDLYWYVDGVTTEHYAVNAAAGANDPFWLNLSLQVGGTWPGDPNNSTPFPATMDVDYVRIYQN